MSYSLTGPRRLVAAIDAVRYLEARGLPGALVECGVWRGGSVQAMLMTMCELGCTDRDVYLYDTFTGMTEPTVEDTSPLEVSAIESWEAADGRPFAELFDDAEFTPEALRRRLEATGYPSERIHIVVGPVEETIPGVAPAAIALLRLDTDWYASTRHELEHLYPRLGTGGVLIVDDYGHWEGCARALDEYLAARAESLFLGRVDYTCRIAVKP